MSTATRTRHLLVLANETCTGAELLETMRERRGGPDAQVLIVVPALTSRLRYWMSDEDAGIAAAEKRLAASLEHCGAGGVPARGALGDADPLQALDDAVQTFGPDEIIIATHTRARENWLERGLVSQARERFSVPITHVIVDARNDEAHVVDHEWPERAAPRRERHLRRDVVLVTLAGILALFGVLLALLLLVGDAPGWLVGTWFLVFDLGFKAVLFVVIWRLFQRRPRADRLDL